MCGFDLSGRRKKGASLVKYAVSLKSNRDFQRLYHKGKHAVTPVLALYCRRSGRPGNRLGLTVGTKVGNAVTRNRVRRRLREGYRLHEDQLRLGFDVVVVARVRAAHVSYWELDRAFLQLADKLGLLRRETE